jgi:hypothetical protein
MRCRCLALCSSTMMRGTLGLRLKPWKLNITNQVTGNRARRRHTQKGSTTQKEHTRTRHQHCGFPFCLDNIKYTHDTSHTRELRKHATALVGVGLAVRRAGCRMQDTLPLLWRRKLAAIRTGCPL